MTVLTVIENIRRYSFSRQWLMGQMYIKIIIIPTAAARPMVLIKHIRARNNVQNHE